MSKDTYRVVRCNKHKSPPFVQRAYRTKGGLWESARSPTRFACSKAFRAGIMTPEAQGTVKRGAALCRGLADPDFRVVAGAKNCHFRSALRWKNRLNISYFWYCFGERDREYGC